MFINCVIEEIFLIIIILISICNYNIQFGGLHDDINFFVVR